MKFLIMTGMSGSGKSGALNVLEDNGYYCIDNIPPQLIPKFAEIARDVAATGSAAMNKIAIVTDIRGGALFSDIKNSIDFLKDSGIDTKIMFLDAADDVIIRRYKETRRRHPLESGGTIETAINRERGILNDIREYADFYIDTSELNVAGLKETVNALLLKNPTESMTVKVTSFGFKYGISVEADVVFDVRCLPNPFYIPELKHKTGLDESVRDYVMKSDNSYKLLDKLTDLIKFMLPLYLKEGKSSLIIAFGCTGGKHRSVTFAELLSKFIIDEGYHCMTVHRDIERK
ncbi:MAG: RNase adapter RapZ [Ruminococcus sp.]|nr:RNase adapter RapZ [Ruminococcus sp.]